MNTKGKHNIIILQGFYLLVFFGIGGITTLLSIYLSEVEGLNGYQIGTIMSIGPIIMIFFQPLWGMIADLTRSPRNVLIGTTVLAGICSLGYLAFHGYYWFLTIAIFVALFQSAIIPLSDSISVQHTAKVNYNYGKVRLYGSLGYGLAVLIMGRISEIFPASIFYGFFISLVLAGSLAIKFPTVKTEAPKKLLSGLKEILMLKKYIVFLIITFMIFGPSLANNTYFGLFIEDRGGTLTGIGIAFFVAVLSEIPFMSAAGSWVKKIGVLHVCLVAGTVSLIRWLLYFFEPSLAVIYATAVLQGFSIGLFIPAGLQYVQEQIPPHIVVTGITLYSAIGNGLGNWFSTFFGGIFYEEFSIYAVYLFYAGLAIVGVALNLLLIKEEKETKLAVLNEH